MKPELAEANERNLYHDVANFVERVRSDAVGRYTHPSAWDRSEVSAAVDGVVGIDVRSDEAFVAKAIDRAKFAMYRELVKARGIRYAGCTIDSFICGLDGSKYPRSAGEATDHMRSFLDNMPDRLQAGEGNLVFIGPPGTGKDHLMMAAMGEAILHYGYSVFWIDGMELFARMKKNTFADQEDLYRKCVSAQIFAISDPVPPEGELSQYDMTMLRRIVERRYSDMAAIWVTTNVDGEADAKRLFSAALLNRLIDGSTQILCSWDSYRKPRDEKNV